MRCLGLVEWFDHYKCVGSIWSDSKGRFRINQFALKRRCEIEEGDYVTFDINKKNNKAIDLNLLRNEIDAESICDILNHNINRIDIWDDIRNDNVIRKYFLMADINDSKKVLLKISSKLSNDRNNQIFSFIPARKLILDDVWKDLSVNQKLMFFMRLIKSGKLTSSKSINSKIIDLLNVLKVDQKSLLLDKLPDENKYDTRIFDYLDATKKITLLNKLIENGGIEFTEYKTRLIQAVSEGEQKTIVNAIKRIPMRFHHDQDLFPILYYIDQVNALWEQRNKVYEYWPYLGFKAQIAAIFRCNCERIKCDWLAAQNNDPIINLLIQLADTELNSHEKQLRFKAFHNELQNRIIEKAWDTDYSIDLTPLLPECNNKMVNYCEGKFWAYVEDGAFCPRLKNRCGFDEGARIVANRKLPWQQWTLLEFIEFNKIDVNIEGLHNRNEYVARMGGWVNRLNEIRESLKCSVCGETLISDMQYSKNLASYNSTVFHCPNGEGHDQNVYISHCWACRKIIDSRKDKIKYHNKYYICLGCGSGPKDSEVFSQGDICPSCGQYNMENIDSFRRIKKCTRCRHTIEPPPDWKITGSAGV